MVREPRIVLLWRKGAILAPSALGTLVSTFNDPRERGRAFGVYGSVAAGGGAIGLVVGGILTQYLSWRWCLYVNLVFAAIAVAGALLYIQGSRPANRPRMDWPGTVLACAGLFLIVFGFSHAETSGWGAPLTIGRIARSPPALTLRDMGEAFQDANRETGMKHATTSVGNLPGLCLRPHQLARVMP